MPYQFPPDIQELVVQKMASGQYASEDDLLLVALRSLSDEEEDLRAVQEAIDEWKAGDEGVSVNEAFDSIRKKYGIA